MNSIAHKKNLIMEAVFCPKCGNEQDIIQSNAIDKMFQLLLWRSFEVKRGLCYGCLWEQRIIRRFRFDSTSANKKLVIR